MVRLGEALTRGAFLPITSGRVPRRWADLKNRTLPPATPVDNCAMPNANMKV
jgi:hypothetical protein